MYVLHVPGVLFTSEFVQASTNRVGYILDTDDCVVEEYSILDIVKMREDVEIEGGTYIETGLFVNERRIYSLLRDEIVLQNHCLSVGNISGTYKFAVWGNDIHFSTPDDKTIFKVGIGYEITAMASWIEWACYIPNKGYRVMFIIAMLVKENEDTEVPMIAVYLFFDIKLRLYVEKVEIHRNLGDIEVDVDSNYLVSSALRARLNLISKGFF